MRDRLIPSLFVLVLYSTTAWAQPRKEAVIVFKDGFTLSGKVVEKRDYIMDASGQSFTIPLSGGLMNLDDGVRRMYLVPGQIPDVLDKKIDRDLLDLRRFASTQVPSKILPGWQVETFTSFNSKWERTLNVHVVRENYSGYFPMDQRIIRATPHLLQIQTLKYDWDIYHLTREFSADDMRVLLAGYFADKKDLKDWDKRKAIAMFLHQAGWHKEAQKALDNLVEEYPSKKESVAGLQETIKKVLANIYVEDVERASKAGQHESAQQRLALYAKENLETLVNEKNLLLATDLKTKYQSLSDKIAQARTLLDAVPKLLPEASRKVWTIAADLIRDELSFDTVAKLETFLVFGQQHVREVEENKRPSQTPEEVLALAASGWMLGNSSAEPDVSNARLLLRARAMVLEYQTTENTLLRNQMLASLFQGGNFSVDVLARIIKNAPPPVPYEKSKFTTAPVKLTIESEHSKGGAYYLQLPPEYHHQRSYPVLLLLHGAREKPEGLMERLSDLAAQHGFILAAPLWGGAGVAYSYTEREHAVVLDTLRDLRRRFQIDSDRVFLFGWEQGGDAALDIGMSHPDEFAGVLPMCGAPRFFTAEQNRYQTNAQYLPFYLVEGDRNGANPKTICGVFKTWVSGSYPALYVEYKGRGSEWYQGELPRMFDWMTRKKRHHPTREMGRRSSVGFGEEFRTMREGDNRFYWLSTDAIDPRCLNSASHWVRTIPPATMVAGISVGNELVVKGGQKEAKIFTQVNIQTKWLRHLWLWLAPSMVDFTKPIRIRVNGNPLDRERVISPNPTVLMEDFFYNGDRQRLYFAKVELNYK